MAAPSMLGRFVPSRCVMLLLVLVSASGVGYGQFANDDFADAIELLGESGAISGATIGATRETGDPEHVGYACPSVWYSWKAPSTGTFEFSTRSAASHDTVLAAHISSAVEALLFVDANSKGCGPRRSELPFLATEGIIYRIAVAGYEADSGTFTLDWQPTSDSVTDSDTKPPLRFGLGVLLPAAYSPDGSLVATCGHAGAFPSKGKESLRASLPAGAQQRQERPG